MLGASLVVAVWERVEIQLVANQSPIVVTTVACVRLAIIGLIVCWGFSRVKATFPFQITPISFTIGFLGAAIWILLCRLNLESQIMSFLGLSPELLGKRSAINPWELYPSDSSRYLFLTIRFTLLILAVPIAEELFLRGFLIRYLASPDWSELTIDRIGKSAIAVTAAYGILTHPSEWIAAGIWFALITLLMLRTKRFWDCVIAHGITNGILGIYIIWFQDWRLW